jgi:hypothetical protein|tara:strand:- start:8012 stop:8191 length:180 start_codon:yes stop_codon:yes gene_type:complete
VIRFFELQATCVFKLRQYAKKLVAIQVALPACAFVENKELIIASHQANSDVDMVTEQSG